MSASNAWRSRAACAAASGRAMGRRGARIDDPARLVVPAAGAALAVGRPRGQLGRALLPRMDEHVRDSGRRTARDRPGARLHLGAEHLAMPALPAEQLAFETENAGGRASMRIWPWCAIQDARTAASVATRAAFFRGLRQARQEDLTAVVLIMQDLPDHAKQTLKHLGTVAAAIQGLAVRDARQQEGRGHGQAGTEGHAQDGGRPGRGGDADPGPAGIGEHRAAAGAQARGDQGAPHRDRDRGGAQVQPGGGVQRSDQGAQAAAARPGL